MYKVKMFEAKEVIELENYLNTFLTNNDDINIIDIRYDVYDTQMTALILYL